MNILIACSGMEVGGAEVASLNLASYLATNGHNIYYFDISAKRIDWKFVDSVKSPQVKVISLLNHKFLNYITWKLNRVFNYFNPNFSFRRLINQRLFRHSLAKYQVDLVSSHLIISDLFCTECLATSAIPLVITEHGDYMIHNIKPYNFLKRGQLKMIFERANHFIPVSKFCANILKSEHDYNGNISVVYNGVNLEPNIDEGKARIDLGIPPDAFVLGMVARGVYHKGWGELFLAYTKLKEVLEHGIHLILVGNGPEIDRIQSMTEDDNIHFMGYQSKPTYWIQAFDLAVLPTYFEALGISILEYLQCRKPVIASNVGGVPEIVSQAQRECGILIDLDTEGRPKVDKIVEAILKLKEDPNLYAQCVSNMPEIIAQFSLTHFGKNYVQTFKEVMNTSRIENE